MPSKLGRLLALSDAEFRRKRTQPAKVKAFKAKPIDVRTFDGEWERHRGAAVRMMAVVMREDSEGLFSKVSVDPQTAGTFAEAICWLTKEAELLRKTASRHDLAAARLMSAVCRYRSAQQEPQARPQQKPSGAEAGAP